MARFIEAIDVPAPIHETFDYLADFANTLEWDPGVCETERLDPDPPARGSRFRVVARFLGRRQQLVYRITVFDPPHRVVLVGENDTVVSVDEISFSPRGEGTRVTYEARLDLRGALRLADPILQWIFQRIGRDAASGLAATLVGKRRGDHEGEAAA